MITEFYSQKNCQLEADNARHSNSFTAHSTMTMFNDYDFPIYPEKIPLKEHSGRVESLTTHP